MIARPAPTRQWHPSPSRAESATAWFPERRAKPLISNRSGGEGPKAVGRRNRIQPLDPATCRERLARTPSRARSRARSSVRASVPGNAEGKRTGKRAGQGRAKAARKTRLAAEVAFSLHSAGMPQVLVRLNRRLGLNKGTRHGTVDSPRPERWVASLALGAMKTLSAFDGREWF